MVAIEIFQDGAPVDLGDPSAVQVAWLDQAAGTIRVTGTEALPVGAYLVRYRLSDNVGTVGYAPNGDKADFWHVVPIPAR